MQISDSNLRIFAFLGAMACLAGVLVFVGVPFILRFTTLFEALSLLVEGIGEYTGNRRVVWLGCAVLALSIVGCCIVTLVVGGALLTCNTSNAVQLCRWLGR